MCIMWELVVCMTVCIDVSGFVIEVSCFSMWWSFRESPYDDLMNLFEEVARLLCCGRFEWSVSLPGRIDD